MSPTEIYTSLLASWCRRTSQMMPPSLDCPIPREAEADAHFTDGNCVATVPHLSGPGAHSLAVSLSCKPWRCGQIVMDMFAHVCARLLQADAVSSDVAVLKHFNLDHIWWPGG